MNSRLVRSISFRALPALALLLLAFSSTDAGAQTAPGPSSDETKHWMEEGAIAFRAGQWERARILLLRAFEVEPKESLAYNLAIAEAKTGHWVEAARHIDYFQRYAAEVSPADKAIVAGILRHVGMVDVEVDTAGATVRIDNESIGRAPLPTLPIYVTPGTHTVRAQKDDGEVEKLIDIVAGGHIKVELKVPPSSKKGPAEVIGAGRPPVGGTDADRSRSPFFEPRTVVVAGGSLLAAVGLGLGTAFALAAHQSRDSIEMSGAGVDLALGEQGCAGRSLEAACAALLRARDRRNNEEKTAAWMFTATGVVAAATVGAYFFWPWRKATVGGARVVPVGLADGAGFILTGDLQ